MDELYNRVVDRMCEAGCSIFYAMAYAQGYVKGRIITSRECVSALMKNLGMTFEEVIDLLEVEEEIAKIIKKEIVEEEA